MKPITPSKPSGSLANQSDLANRELGALDSASPDDITQAIGAVPKSTITGKHDAGSDANETIDGLNETDEMTRHVVEDLPSGSGDDVEDIPVFDRGDTLPRV